MKIFKLILISIVTLVYLAACTTAFENLAQKPSQQFSEEQRPGSDYSNHLHCEGYLTSNPAENFCSKSVPDDWQGFDFNGEQYYSVPLANRLIPVPE